MKRNILNMFAVFVLLLACTLGFVACGKKGTTNNTPAATLTQEDVAGVYQVTKVAYTPDQGSQGIQCEITLPEYKNLVIEGAGESTDPDYALKTFELNAFEHGIFVSYNVETGDPHGQILYRGIRRAYWHIENNQVVLEDEGTDFEGATLAYTPGKIVVSNITYDDDTYGGTMTLTLEYRSLQYIAGEWRVNSMIYRPDDDAHEENNNPRQFTEDEYEITADYWATLDEDYASMTDEAFENKYDFPKELKEAYIDAFDTLFCTWLIADNGDITQKEDSHHSVFARMSFEKGVAHFTWTAQNANLCTYTVEWDDENDIVYVTVVEPHTVNGCSGEYVYELYIQFS